MSEVSALPAGAGMERTAKPCQPACAGVLPDSRRGSRHASCAGDPYRTRRTRPVGYLLRSRCPNDRASEASPSSTQQALSIFTVRSGTGLASLLLVTAGDTLRAYSLARTPQREWGHEFDQRCLIEALNATANALKIRNIVYGAESGRLWKEHADFFRPKERIDQVLLDNLTESHKSLCKSLSPDAAQALLIQTMFIAYLEDRKIITADYFKDANRDAADSFSSLLARRDVKYLSLLFATLKDDFNGNLFVAPCSFDPRAKAPSVKVEHLDVLASFRSGREEMAKGGQYRFWGYRLSFHSDRIGKRSL